MIAFFSDDTRALHVASLVALALRPLDGSLATPLVVSRHLSPEEAAQALALAGRRGRRLAVIPLRHFEEDCVRRRLGLAVLLLGPDFLGAAGAMRAFARNAGGPDLAPAWLLPCRAPVRFDAGARSTSRVLPINVPPPNARDMVDVREGLPTPEQARLGVGLATLLEIALRDPTAKCLDRARVSEALAHGGSAADLDLRARLLRLAGSLADNRDLDVAAQPSHEPSVERAACVSARRVTKPRASAPRRAAVPPTRRVEDAVRAVRR